MAGVRRLPLKCLGVVWVSPSTACAGLMPVVREVRAFMAVFAMMHVCGGDSIDGQDLSCIEPMTESAHVRLIQWSETVQ